MITKRKILRIHIMKGERIEKEDLIAADRLVNIFINGKHFVTLMASPKNIRELAIGHLLGQGIINRLGDIERVRVRGENVDVGTKTKIRVEVPKFLKVVPSACGVSDDVLKLLGKLDIPKLKSKMRFKARTISDAFRLLHSVSRIFKKTGGTHAAALFARGGKLRFCMEDVGRHNAVDKVIGRGLLDGVDFTKSFMVSTGRLSADIVIKCARAGIPLAASKAAPLQSGIAAAELSGLTLVGFVRGGKLNVYTRPMRVEF